MKLTKGFCWDIFRRAAMNRDPSFCTDGYIYDIIYLADTYRITNKTIAHIEDLPDWTPLINREGIYINLGGTE